MTTKSLQVYHNHVDDLANVIDTAVLFIDIVDNDRATAHCFTVNNSCQLITFLTADRPCDS